MTTNENETIGNTDIRRLAKVAPAEGLSEHWPSLQKIFADNPDAVVAITYRGKPVMALMSWESWEDTEDLAAGMETLEIMANPKATAALQESLAGIGSGNLIPGDVALQELIAGGLIDAEQI